MNALEQARGELTDAAVARLVTAMRQPGGSLAGLLRTLRGVLEEHARGWRRAEASASGAHALRPGDVEAQRRGRLGGKRKGAALGTRKGERRGRG